MWLTCSRCVLVNKNCYTTFLQGFWISRAEARALLKMAIGTIMSTGTYISCYHDLHLLSYWTLMHAGISLVCLHAYLGLASHGQHAAQFDKVGCILGTPRYNMRRRIGYEPLYMYKGTVYLVWYMSGLIRY